MQIIEVDTFSELEAVAHLFDNPLRADAAKTFLERSDHHLLVAYDDDEQPVGLITGVELTHPDKATEMYINELGVDEAAQRQGIGTALVEALVELARTCACSGIWGVTEPDNQAALATYRRASLIPESTVVLVAGKV